MTSITQTRRVLATLVTTLAMVAAVAIGITGCTALDSPEGITDRFTDTVSDVDGVVSVEATAHKPDPQSTAVQADIDIADELGEPELHAILDAVDDFQRASISVSGVLRNSTYTLPVTIDAEINRSVASLAADIAEEPEVDSVLAAMEAEGAYRVEVMTSADPPTLFPRIIDRSDVLLALTVSNPDTGVIAAGTSEEDMSVTATSPDL